MTRPLRIRLLLLALAATAIAGLLFWPEAEEPRELGVNFRGPARAPQTSPVLPVPETTYARPPVMLSDAEHVEHLKDFGVLAMWRDGSMDGSQPDVGNFYWVTPSEPKVDLAALGFIRGTVLLDTASRFVALGDSGAVPHLRLTARQYVDSQLRVREDGCSEEIRTPMRRVGEGGSPWLLAFVPGGAEGIPPEVWQAANPKTLDATRRAEAVRLALHLPLTKNELFWSGPDSLFANTPANLVTYFRFTLDGAEVIVGEVRRSGRSVRASEGETVDVLEQRSFIAERDAGDPRLPFRVVWHHLGAGDEDRIITQTPLLVMRLGSERLLTVYMSRKGTESIGGQFVSRLGPGTWKEVASWIAGC